MTARESSQEHLAGESLTGRTLLIFILFAIEILVIDLLKLPDIMAFDHYAFCDSGANLTATIPGIARPKANRRLRLHYGLLPILVGRIWFAVTGQTPHRYQALMTVCDLGWWRR